MLFWHARAGTQEGSLRVALGGSRVFLVVKELPSIKISRPEIPMDERPSYLRSRLIALKKFSAQGGDAG